MTEPLHFILFPVPSGDPPTGPVRVGNCSKINQSCLRIQGQILSSLSSLDSKGLMSLEKRKYIHQLNNTHASNFNF